MFSETRPLLELLGIPRALDLDLGSGVVDGTGLNGTKLAETLFDRETLEIGGRTGLEDVVPGWTGLDPGGHRWKTQGKAASYAIQK